MNSEIFENRNNSLADYSIYLNELKRVVLQNVTKDNVSMETFNYVSIISDDIEKILKK
jgi:hypothetical protein